MKKIYFPNITFQGSPIVWSLNEETHQATCLFYCVKDFSIKDFKKPLKASKFSPDLFEQIPGILKDDDSVIIEDIRNFSEPFLHIDETERERKLTPRSQSNSILSRQESAFFKLSKSGNMRDETNSPHLFKRSLTASSLPVYDHIILDKLIQNNDAESTLWGDTIAYKTYFTDKTDKDAQTRKAAFLKTAMTFNVMVQYEKNNHLYPLKSKLITAIGELLDILDPMYVSWAMQKNVFFDKKVVFHYFQNAVLEAMLNGRINNKATEFEDSENTHLSSALQEYAVAKARALRAELMLIKFHVLLNPALSLLLALDKKEEAKSIEPALTSLRDIILKQPQALQQDIKNKLQEISELIIQSGIVEEFNKRLSDQLNHQIAIKTPVIMNFHSFQSLLQSILEKQISSKKELIPNIIAQVTMETIRQISAFKEPAHNQYIASLTSVDKDFYLCPKWFDKLTEELAEVKLKHPKKVLAYSQVIASKVVGFLQQQMQKYSPTLENDTASTSSTLTLN